MTSSSHSILRRTAAGAGAFALALGAMACTGGEDEPAPSEEAPPAEGSPSEQPGTTVPGDETAESAGPFREDELEAASARFVEALYLLGDRDWEGACGLVLDPSTGTAPEGERLRECVQGVEPAVSAYADALEPGTLAQIDPSMIGTEDNGDGTVSLSILDQPIDVTMVPGEDGRWYFAIPF